MQVPAVWTGFGVAVLVVLTGIAVWLVREMRNRSTEDRFDPGDLIGNFEEMHRQGEISAEEFRSIEAVMGNQSGNCQTQTGRTD